MDTACLQVVLQLTGGHQREPGHPPRRTEAGGLLADIAGRARVDEVHNHVVILRVAHGRRHAEPHLADAVALGAQMGGSNVVGNIE